MIMSLTEAIERITNWRDQWLEVQPRMLSDEAKIIMLKDIKALEIVIGYCRLHQDKESKST